MNQSKYILKLIEAFEEGVEIYAKDTNATNVEYIPVYGGKEDIEHLKEYKAFIDYDIHTIILRFTIHTFLAPVNHVLEAYIQFDNHPAYPIHDMVGYYRILSTDAFIIPCISNALTMKESIEYLSNSIAVVEELLLEEDHSAFYEDYKKSVIAYSHIKSDDYDEDYHYQYIEDIQVFETSMAYIDFLLQRNQSAIKKYQKKKNLTMYEQWLLEMLLDGYEFDDEDPLPYSVIYHLNSYTKSGTIKNDKKELCVVALSMFLLTIVFGIFYYVFHKGLSLMLLRDVLYYIGEDPFFLFLPSFISAVACSYYARYFLYKLFFKRDYTNFIEKDYLQNTSKSNLFMYRFVKVVLILSLIFTFMTTNQTIQFVSDGVVDNSEFFALKGNHYAYEDIEIHHYKDQYNGFNELIGAPTYVISTKDKDIDLYYYADVEDLDKEIIPYLKDNGVNIVYKDILEWKD